MADSPLEITLLDDGIVISNTLHYKQYFGSDEDLKAFCLKIHEAFTKAPLFHIDLPYPCVIHDKRTKVRYPEGVRWQEVAQAERMKRYKPR